MTKEEILHKEAVKACENPTGKIAVYSAMDRYADQQTASLREQLTEKEKELKAVNDLVIDIAKLLGEHDLGLDGKTWSIDDFREAIEALKKENEELREEIRMHKNHLDLLLNGID